MSGLLRAYQHRPQCRSQHIFEDGSDLKTHQLPCGWLYPHTRLCVGSDVAQDPELFLREIQTYGHHRRKAFRISWKHLDESVMLNGPTQIAQIFCDHLDPPVRNVRTRELTAPVLDLVREMKNRTRVPVTLVETGKYFRIYRATLYRQAPCKPEAKGEGFRPFLWPSLKKGVDSFSEIHPDALSSVPSTSDLSSSTAKDLNDTYGWLKDAGPLACLL